MASPLTSNEVFSLTSVEGAALGSEPLYHLTVLAAASPAEGSGSTVILKSVILLLSEE